jgi:hypothetical protein
VFAGRVESVKAVQKKGMVNPFAPRRVLLRVTEPFLGVNTAEVEVDTGAGGGDCGYRFREGREYLVYAHRSGPTGRLQVSICSRTAALESAAEDVAYLRQAVRPGAAGPGRISGLIERVDRNLATGQERRRPAAGLPVILDRDRVPSRATTDAQGRFAIDGLAAGRYDVRLDVPEGQHGRVAPNPVELRDSRGCAEVSGSVSYDGRVRGRVVDASGRGVPGLTIELTVPAGLDDSSGPERIRALTGQDGRYELRQIPPGRYIVGINTQRAADAPVPFPRIFHPGVEALDGATRVALTGGQQTEIGDLVLPRAIRHVAISGVVLDPDGTPARDARVFLKGSAETDYILGEPAVTDASGRFMLTAFDGFQYRLFAERIDAGTRRIESSEQSPVTAAPGLPPFKLTLRAHY